MFRRRKEFEKKPELTAEQRVELYAELLLTNGDGEERAAVAEHVISDDIEPEHRIARAEFFTKDGGFYVVEYRDHEHEPTFVTYMRPVEQIYDATTLPDDAKWATAMICHNSPSSSIEDVDNTELMANVLKAYFGDLPSQA